MYVCWYITTKCTLSCKYCYSYRNVENLEYCKTTQIAASLLAETRLLNITGGEPFLYDKILSILQFCDKIAQGKVLLTVSTNGLYLKNYFQQLPMSIRYNVSLDTIDRKTAAELRGESYDLSTVLSNINELIKRGFHLKLNTVLTTENVRDIKELAVFVNSCTQECKSDLIWRISECAMNKNVSKQAYDLVIPRSHFQKVVHDLRQLFPAIEIVSVTEKMLNSDYILVMPNGEVHLPYLDHPICNMLDSNLAKNLEKAHFDFAANNNLAKHLYQEYAKGRP